jgi:2-polyprenyl-3-methyl-5-hydroxy-6-metoxy-1,4-benzoquinol methylase
VNIIGAVQLLNKRMQKQLRQIIKVPIETFRILVQREFSPERVHVDLSQEEVARYWDINADLWAAQVRNGYDVWRDRLNTPAFMAFAGDVNGKSILDAGCGEGTSTRLLARNGARVIGVDISRRMIELAIQEEQKEHLGIRYEVASYSDLSLFGTASFDVVVSFMTLMDGPNLEGVFKEMGRVLRPTGELVFSVLHPCFFTKGLGWIRDKAGNATKLTVAHYFDDAPIIDYWKFYDGGAPEDVPLFSVPRFHWTLSQYVNGLVRAGLVIKEIEEVRPSDDTCIQNPWLMRWRDHASPYLYVRAAKP